MKSFDHSQLVDDTLFLVGVSLVIIAKKGSKRSYTPFYKPREGKSIKSVKSLVRILQPPRSIVLLKS